MIRLLRRAALLLAFACSTAVAGATADGECAVAYTVSPLDAPTDFEGQIYGIDIASRRNGKPLIAFYGRAPFDGIELPVEGLWLHSCVDRACSPGTSKNLVTSTFMTGRPHIVLRDDGRPLVFYAMWDHMTVFDCRDVACSHGESRQLSGDASGAFDAGVFKRSDGRPVLVYLNRTQNTVELMTCADADCTTASTRPIETFGTEWSASSIGAAMTADDRVIAYHTSYRSSDGDSRAMITVCDTPACDAPVAHEIGDPAKPHYWPQVAVKQDGSLVLYRTVNESFGAQGEVQFCADATCAVSTTVKTPVGTSTSQLMLDPDDHPVLNQYGFNWGYLRCGLADCSTGFTSTLLGTAGFNGGAYVVMERARTATPAMAIVDYDANLMKSAICSHDDVFGNDAEPRVDGSAAEQ